MKEYIIVSGNDAYVVENEVNKYIKQGYRPWGALVIQTIATRQMGDNIKEALTTSLLIQPMRR